jgi:hypothetical protein
VTLEIFDFRCSRGVGLTFGFQQLDCAQNALFQSLKIGYCQGFASLIRDVHRYRCHPSSQRLGEIILLWAQYIANANAGRQIPFAPCAYVCRN